MFDKLDGLISRLESTTALNPNDPSLMSALASAYLAKEVRDLKGTIDLVTAASDAVPGGFALRVVNVNK